MLISGAWRLCLLSPARFIVSHHQKTGFAESSKREWLGENYYLIGVSGNAHHLSAIPNIRAAYRDEALRDERLFVHTSSGKEGADDYDAWTF